MFKTDTYEVEVYQLGLDQAISQVREIDKEKANCLSEFLTGFQKAVVGAVKKVNEGIDERFEQMKR